MRDGSIDNPYTLAEALGNTAMRPGHTLHLRGGVYAGTYTSVLAGSAAQPIAIRSYSGEQPIVDGALTVNGADVLWEDVTIRYSGWATRVSAQSGSTPSDLPASQAPAINAPRSIFRRCTFIDTAGPGFWSPAVDATFEECLFLNNGWDAPDRGHGHGLYLQNLSGTKTLRRCVFGPGYSDWSIHAYAESGSLQGFDIVECVSIGKTMLIGGQVAVDRLTMTRNILWGGILQTGYRGSVVNGTATLTDNILANGATRTTAGTWTSLAETGTDTTTGNRILTYGGLVVVFNQAGASTVTAASAGTYRNCLNPAETITLAAGGSLPMTGWTVAAPIGAAAPLISSTFPTFGAFLVTP